MLDLAIGMVFIFLLLSLICTALVEILEKFLKYRSTDLERGIRELLHDTLDGKISAKSALATAKKELKEAKENEKEEKQKAVIEKEAELAKRMNGIASKVYQHSLISGLYRGPYKSKGRELPAYIPASNFALALLDCVLPAGKDNLSGSVGGGPISPDPAAAKSLVPLRDAIYSNTSGLLSDPKLQNGLLTLVDSAGNDIDKARENIENWYNSSMDRVSGWFKRRTQGILILIGLLLASALNVDSIAVFKSLMNDAPLRNSLVAAAQEYAKTPTSAASDSIRPEERVESNAIKLYNLRLPIGWDWDTSIYSKNNFKKAAAKSRNYSFKMLIDSLKTSSDSIRKASLKSDSTNLRKADSLSIVADSLSKVFAKGDTASAPRKITKEEYLSNRKLALPWYYESKLGDEAKILDVLNTKGFWFKLIGWLITALAVSLGAPFWFDTLNKIMVIRSTVKPHEKSPEEASEDRQKKTKT
ncbi:hypothetical protein [Aridibaculum aurantiacum]|uniref:hypothetical protein n=1 Tax=Aridibaculum aurantiacum TaxID=2810307 RepID=UPI001A96A3CD|nr:hypothetical protein [Aridibaculum aurantiacum]